MHEGTLPLAAPSALVSNPERWLHVEHHRFIRATATMRSMFFRQMARCRSALSLPNLLLAAGIEGGVAPAGLLIAEPQVRELRVHRRSQRNQRPQPPVSQVQPAPRHHPQKDRYGICRVADAQRRDRGPA